MNFKMTEAALSHIKKTEIEIDKARERAIKECMFGEEVIRSKHSYHIIAGVTRSSVEMKINENNGFLQLFPSAKYYPNGDKNIKSPHIKLNDKIILVCGHSNKDMWKCLLGTQFGAAMIYDFNLCDVEFKGELFMRTNDSVETI